MIIDIFLMELECVSTLDSSMAPNYCPMVDDFSQELLHFFDEMPYVDDIECSPSSGVSAAAVSNSVSTIHPDHGQRGLMVMNTPSSAGLANDSIPRRQIHRISSNNNVHIRGGHAKRCCNGKTKGKELQEFTRKSSLKRHRAPVVGLSGRDDHILRERLRRDDMSGKFSILEGLLPWRAKRDRTAIVDDAIGFVTEMQKTLKRLERKIYDRDCSLAEYCRFDHRQFGGCDPGEIPNAIDHSNATYEFRKRYIDPASSSLGHHDKSQLMASPEIHVQLEICTSQIAIEISCSSRAGFMTNLMTAMEELHLDVYQCTYSKVLADTQCIVIAKQRPLCVRPPLEKIVSVLQGAF